MHETMAQLAQSDFSTTTSPRTSTWLKRFSCWGSLGWLGYLHIRYVSDWKPRQKRKKKGDSDMNCKKEKMPTAATVSNLEEKSCEKDSLTIIPQDEKDFFDGLREWYAEQPIFEWEARTV